MPEPTDSVEIESPAAPSSGGRSQRSGSSTDRVKTFVVHNARMLIVLGVLIAGIVIVMLGWYGAAHTNIITEQIPYLISGGLLGLGLIILSGILATSWLQQRSSDDLRRELARALANSVPMEARATRESASPNGHAVFALPGGRSYHDAGCPLLEGKQNVKQLLASQAAASGLAPCRLCEPV